jgi:flagellar basal-body rod modification protein FlgD
MDPFSPISTDGSIVPETNNYLAGNRNLGRDDFLQMLVTQLTNQDPLNPLEGHEFAAQLAQFSSVEALLNIEETMGAQIEMNGLLAQTISSGIATELIGQTVEAQGDVVGWNGSGEVPLAFKLDFPAEAVQVTVRNEAGQVVRTFDLGKYEAGKHELTWDGTNNSGALLGEGTYTFEVAATDANGEDVGSNTFTRGKVDRVSFGAEGILLWLGGVSVQLAAVESVYTGA